MCVTWISCHSTWFNFFVIFNFWMIVEFVFAIIKWYARASNEAAI